MELRQWKLARQLAQVRTHPLFSPLLRAVVRVRHSRRLSLALCMQVYGAESVGARIEESRVVHLLATQNDTAGAGEALSGLQLHEAVAIVTTLLDKPISSDPARNHPLKLFLVQVRPDARPPLPGHVRLS